MRSEMRQVDYSFLDAAKKLVHLFLGRCKNPPMLWNDDDIVLLGAGASCDAGIPTSAEMTAAILDQLVETSPYSREAAAMTFMCGTLIAEQATHGDTSRSLDVEAVFSAIQMLADRSSLEIAPFIASWLPGVSELDRTGLLPPAFDRDFREAIIGDIARPGGANGSPYALLTKFVDEKLGFSAGSVFESLSTKMIDVLRQLVQTEATKVKYLHPLVSRGLATHGLTIATLNYDRTVEVAAEQACVPLTTGMQSWIDSGRWDWPESGVRLLKLHGSVDWYWKHETKRGELPRDVIAVGDGPNGCRPALVFGQREKLRAEGPFLSLLAEFEAQLAAAQRLVVIGYSFRDAHINAVIRRWTWTNSDRTLFIIDPSWNTADRNRKRASSHTFADELDQYLMPWQAPSTPADSPSEWPFQPRLEVLEQKCGDALASTALAG